MRELVHYVESFGLLVEQYIPALPSADNVTKFQVRGFAGRENKNSDLAAVEVMLIKLEYVLRVVAGEGFGVFPPAVLFIFLPLLVAFRADRVPIIENLVAGNPESLRDLRDAGVSEGTD